MNMITLMNEAWDDCNLYTHEQNEVSFKNLLSHGFAEMDRFYHKANPDYGGRLFVLVQDLIIWFILADRELLRGEYDAYVKYCEWADIKPLSAKQIVERHEELDIEYIRKTVKHLSEARDYIPEDDYEAFVTSLCFLSLFGDKEVDKEEYGIIANFFNKAHDYCPSWEKFKKEF